MNFGRLAPIGSAVLNNPSAGRFGSLCIGASSRKGKHTMQIYAMIAGLRESDFPVDIEPHETIATLFAKMKNELRSMELPHEFTAAYSIIHTRKDGLLLYDPDNLSLEEGDPNIMVNYLTPAARLDPNKTVQHYFGTRVKPDAASIVLTLPTQSLAQQKKKNRELEEASLTAVQQANKNMPMGQSIEREEAAAGAAASMAPHSPWQWVGTYLPWAASCLPILKLHDAEMSE